MNTWIQGIALGIAFATAGAGMRALIGAEHLLLVAWWMVLAFAIGFWTAKT